MFKRKYKYTHVNVAVVCVSWCSRQEETPRDSRLWDTGHDCFLLTFFSCWETHYPVSGTDSYTDLLLWSPPPPLSHLLDLLYISPGFPEVGWRERFGEWGLWKSLKVIRVCTSLERCPIPLFVSPLSSPTCHLPPCQTHNVRAQGIQGCWKERWSIF